MCESLQIRRKDDALLHHFMYINKDKEPNRYIVDVFALPSISIRSLINGIILDDVNKKNPFAYIVFQISLFNDASLLN